MCLAIPGKIVSIDGSDPEMRMARVQFGETIREICIQWVPDAGIGDYIIAHVGTALSRVDEKDAAFVLEAWKEIGNSGANPG
jgi:hydrogenase expression/formation protein HypC